MRVYAAARRGKFKTMKFFKQTIEKYRSRPFLGKFGGTVWSAIVTAAFAAYNVFLGMRTGGAWFYHIGVYYALLTCARAAILLSEAKNLREQNEENKIIREKRTFRRVAVFTILIDLCIAAPIAMMTLGKKNVNAGTIAAITMAAYTTYKITAAVVRFNKAKSRAERPCIKQLRQIGVSDALVSVLSLQNTLISVFSQGDEARTMFTLSCVSSAAIYVCLIAISLVFYMRERPKQT